MLLDINTSQFGTSADPFFFDHVDSFATDVNVKFQKGVRKNVADYTYDFAKELNYDYPLVSMHMASREVGMLDCEQNCTIWFNFDSYINFKVLRSPSRKNGGYLNNGLIFNNRCFKTPNELFAYILEVYCGLDVQLGDEFDMTHKKKSVYIKGVK
tara:strand:+ start:126 stop:590 length:465 start_codon:yes stop_codon:yes gene_type:complete